MPNKFMQIVTLRPTLKALSNLCEEKVKQDDLSVYDELDWIEYIRKALGNEDFYNELVKETRCVELEFVRKAKEIVDKEKQSDDTTRDGTQ